MEIKTFKTEIEGKELSIELGKLAQQANGSAVVKYGQTVVLATAVMGEKATGKNYLPLTVDYEEKFYAAGKIKGSKWVKREGRPTDEAILTGRLIDRSIRPLFDPKIRNDIQVVLTVLSFDGENDPALPALVGASTALSISDIPWNGPIAGISVGQDEAKQWIITSTLSAKAKSGLELFISGMEQDNEILANMIEGHAPEATEEKLIEGINIARKEIKKLLDFQKQIIKDINPKKKELSLVELDENLKKEIEEFVSGKLEKAIYGPDRKERMKAMEKLREELLLSIEEKYKDDSKKISDTSNYYEGLLDTIVHKNILSDEKRPDGRKLDELRNIETEVGILPRTHGSGLFKRGETQVLSVLTLGSPGMEQYFDQMELEGTKRFFHDYNFPPFSVGETGRMGGPGRREIGHGALAEKAIQSIIPDKDKFPYTIRVVSEVLSSNGSSSMASVCGTTLALLDGGVPIKNMVAGIAMGLMIDPFSAKAEGKCKILTDIQGPEDHYGDMDLKVAGTKNGVTAIQMDVKINGIKIEILEKTFIQARKARLEILEKMEKTIKEPRAELSPFAPRIYTLQVNPAKIGLIIGPGGKTINEMIAETGAAIDIEDDGTVFITCDNADGAKTAISRIKSLTREVKLGETFNGKVVKNMEFGAFVELYPKQDGLLHVSEMGSQNLREGDFVEVKVKRIDEHGKISLELASAEKKQREKTEPAPAKRKPLLRKGRK